MVEAEEVTDENDARVTFKSIRGVCNDARNKEWIRNTFLCQTNRMRRARGMDAAPGGVG
jgi:hypothetical protein